MTSGNLLTQGAKSSGFIPGDKKVFLTTQFPEWFFYFFGSKSKIRRRGMGE